MYCAGQASHANGGQISAESGAPWMSPVIRREFPRWLFDRHRPFSLDLFRMGSGAILWLGSSLRNTSRRRYLANHGPLHALTRYSLGVWKEYETDLGSALIPGSGVLYLYRTRREWEGARELLSWEGDLSIQVEALDPDGCIKRMPHLQYASIAPAGGFWYPDDRFGDCEAACRKLLDHVVRNGARMHLGDMVRSIEPGPESATLVTGRGRYRAGRVVIAAGVGSVALARSAGIRLPIYPVKGYTRTYSASPLSCDGPALADQSRKVVLTPLGNRLRAAGLAEFAGFDDQLDDRFLRRIQDSVSDWLPELRHASSELDWACLRAMTPDGLPILGAAQAGTVILNVGHGPLGWTLAAGSARIVADGIGSHGNRCDIDPSPFRFTQQRGSVGWPGILPASPGITR
ncbi:D-amino acid dehydrogenase small subunit [mine drainage metagenome]|uniref:D-amino acid dehydrogenase small subunit n=1 Tax=mine drainage metagenome TaxID=410659 RepID=T1AAA0_9ZZZZ